MKKKYPLLLAVILFSFLSSTSTFATPDDQVQRVGTTVEVAEEEDRLAKISDIEEVRVLIDAVKEARSPASEGPLTKSEWEDLWEDSISSNEELKVQVFAILNGRTTDSEGNFLANDTNHNYDLGNFEKKQTTSLLKLQEYLKERLAKKLFGENPSETSGVKAVMDHNVFQRLYKSQIGKNLMVELANYCINSDKETGLVPFKTDRENREKAAVLRKLNMEEINQYGASGAESADGVRTRSFDLCISRLGSSCEAGSNYMTLPNRQNQFPSVTDDRIRALGDSIPKFTIPQPCELSRYMTAVKITLKELEELEGEEQMNSDQSRNLFAVEIKQKDVLNTDSVVNISSGELLNGEGNQFREEAQAEALSAEECIQQAGQPCNNSYTVSGEESVSIQDEFNLRNIAMEKKVEAEIFTDDAEPQQMIDFLVKKGMSEENISRLVSQLIAQEGNSIDEEIAAYRHIILNRFEREREALHDSLTSRLNARAITDPNDQDELARKATEIRQVIEDGPTQLAQVYQYANVVSSFLSVTGENGSTSTNSAALAAELENPFNSEADPRAPASQPQDLSALQEFATEEEQADDSGQSTGATLSSGEIDSIQFSMGREEEEAQ